MFSRRSSVVQAIICALITALGSFASNGCNRQSKAPVTISFLDPEWSNLESYRSKPVREALLDFTRQTGIQVKHIPAPEDSGEQLELIRRLLEQGPGGPDVYVIDVVWPGILSQDLLDLGNQFSDELKSEDPDVLNNNRVDGRLVAVPFHTNVGVLYYRTDLLRKYGFRGPPKTWDELEKMAIRIQNGERRAGQPNFWGFVWPGAANEALTCNALEWQYAEGGGRIIEDNRTISVDNPGTIKAWKRAAHWVGWISPPTVTAYREGDAVNAFDNAGRSAFLRTWASDYFLSAPYFPNIDASGVTSLPGPTVIGGNSLAVSRFSSHQPEAIQLIRFLLHREQELEIVRASSPPPHGRTLFELPPILKAYSHLDPTSAQTVGKVFVRPSTISGEKYEQVSRAYSEAAFSVLTKRRTAEEAASQLEDDLVRITGFRRQQSGVNASLK
jgi:trehalose/maltose transport system substrate-binding protein